LALSDPGLKKKLKEYRDKEKDKIRKKAAEVESAVG
jgi:phosphoribosylcarboxyaminoimidazole (NCAIR) mutase